MGEFGNVFLNNFQIFSTTIYDIGLGPMVCRSLDKGESEGRKMEKTLYIETKGVSSLLSGSFSSRLPLFSLKQAGTNY